MLRFSQSAISQYYAGDGKNAETVYDIAQKIQEKKIEFTPGIYVFTKIPIMDTWGSHGYTTLAGNIYQGTFSHLENGCTYALNNRSLVVALLAGLTHIGVYWIHPGRIIESSYILDPVQHGERVLIKETGQYISIPKE